MVQLTMQLAHHTGTAKLCYAEVIAQGALLKNKNNMSSPETSID